MSPTLQFVTVCTIAALQGHQPRTPPLSRLESSTITTTATHPRCLQLCNWGLSPAKYDWLVYFLGRTLCWLGVITVRAEYDYSLQAALCPIMMLHFLKHKEPLSIRCQHPSNYTSQSFFWGHFLSHQTLKNTTVQTLSRRPAQVYAQLWLCWSHCLLHDGGQWELPIFCPNKPVCFVMEQWRQPIQPWVRMRRDLDWKEPFVAALLPSLPADPPVTTSVWHILFMEWILPGRELSFQTSMRNDSEVVFSLQTPSLPLFFFFCFHPSSPRCYLLPSLRKSLVSCLSSPRLPCQRTISHMSDSSSVDTVQVAIWEI